MDVFKCEFCIEEPDILYEGWFRNGQSFNPFAKGTVSAGLLQLRRACKKCMQKAIDSGLSVAKSIPGDQNEE